GNLVEAAGASLFRRPKFVHERVYRQTSAVLDYDVRFDPLSCFSELVELFELEFKFVGFFRSRRGWCSKKLKLRVVANCFHRICQTIAGTCGSTTPKIRKAKHPLSFSRAGAQFWRRSVRLCSGQALLTLAPAFAEAAAWQTRLFRPLGPPVHVARFPLAPLIRTACRLRPRTVDAVPLDLTDVISRCEKFG